MMRVSNSAPTTRHITTKVKIEFQLVCARAHKVAITERAGTFARQARMRRPAMTCSRRS